MEGSKENPLDSQEKKSNFSGLPLLDDRHEDLQEQIESDEEELPPPEADKNEANELNIGTIFGFIFLLIIIVIMIIMVAGSTGRKKKAQQKELDKAGSKFEVQFKENAPEQLEEAFEYGNEEAAEEESIDDVLDSMPDNLKPTPQTPAPAPVTPVGGSRPKSDRPDTRNSKSPRKIDGLIGQSAPADTNQNIVKAMISGGSYPSSSGSGGMTKEEYVQQMMERTKQLQDQMYGGSAGGFGGGYGNSNQTAAYQQNREQFYANGSGTGGNGQFMSYTSLWDGTVISGALVTEINTDNPGVVIARVTENVYSSYDHSFLLVPEGSMLYATYNSSVSYGQNKVQVAWNLLIRPDGYRISLGNMNGVNAQGASGYKGQVNNHPFETLKALGMVAIYSMIQTEVTNDIKDTNNQYMQNAMSDMYRETARIGNKIIDRALDIKPTIRIKSGTEIKLITNTPLELPPVQINPVTRKYIRTR